VQPDTNYVRLGQDRIGYQVFGHDPPDVVTTIGSFSHMDLVWEDPRVALYFRSLGSFSRVIRFATAAVPAFPTVCAWSCPHHGSHGPRSWR